MIDIREARWLTAERVRGYSILLCLASFGLLVDAWLKATGTVGSDFLAFWGAGQVTAGGHPALAYDLAVQERVQLGTGSEGWFAFVNPPPFLFLVAPFGMLPFPMAWIAWVAATYALWAWAAIRAFPRYWLPVLAFPGALIAAGHAQNGLLTGALLVGGVALLDRRPALAGALLGALIIKPHLALLVPFWLAAGGRWKAFAAAGSSATGLLVLSWAVFGTETMLAYMTSWDASAQIMRGAGTDFYLRLSTLYGQLCLIMPSGAALAVQGLVSAGMVALAALSWRRLGQDGMATGALALAGTGLASPYLFNYDLPFLVLPVLWLAREGLARGFRPYEKLALVALYFAPYATRAAALPLGVNLMPLALAALVWLIWTRGPKPAAGQYS
ncbi:MAG TPA: glycosyltransferase family 87 protein [Sphingomonadaceae bacterium]|nr:glycosyltransferase family 87 protein [Sphingomonadaceae bacterium]